MDVITVKIGKVPGLISDCVINGHQPRTIATCLQLAGLTAEGSEMRLNGTIVTDVNTAVTHGQTILLFDKIKGA